MRALTVLILGLQLGCGVTAAELRTASSWVDNALRACPAPCSQEPPRKCFAAALALAAPTAGRGELTAATAACAAWAAP